MITTIPQRVVAMTMAMICSLFILHLCMVTPMVAADTTDATSDTSPTLTLIMVLQRTSDPLHVTRTLSSASLHIDSYHIMYIGHDNNDDALLMEIRRAIIPQRAHIGGTIHTVCHAPIMHIYHRVILI
jgi:hypothetical protein